MKAIERMTRLRNDTAVSQSIRTAKKRMVIEPGEVIEVDGDVSSIARPLGSLTLVVPDKMRSRRHKGMDFSRSMIAPFWRPAVYQHCRGRHADEQFPLEQIQSLMDAGPLFNKSVNLCALQSSINELDENASVAEAIALVVARGVLRKSVKPAQSESLTAVRFSSIFSESWRKALVADGGMRNGIPTKREAYNYEPPSNAAQAATTTDFDVWRPLIEHHRVTIENLLGQCILSAVRKFEGIEEAMEAKTK